MHAEVGQHGHPGRRMMVLVNDPKPLEFMAQPVIPIKKKIKRQQSQDQATPARGAGKNSRLPIGRLQKQKPHQTQKKKIGENFLKSRRIQKQRSEIPQIRPPVSGRLVNRGPPPTDESQLHHQANAKQEKKKEGIPPPIGKRFPLPIKRKRLPPCLQFDFLLSLFRLKIILRNIGERTNKCCRPGRIRQKRTGRSSRRTLLAQDRMPESDWLRKEIFQIFLYSRVLCPSRRDWNKICEQPAEHRLRCRGFRPARPKVFRPFADSAEPIHTDYKNFSYAEWREA